MCTLLLVVKFSSFCPIECFHVLGKQLARHSRSHGDCHLGRMYFNLLTWPLCVHMCGNFQGSALSFCHVGCKNPNQVSRIGAKPYV